MTAPNAPVLPDINKLEVMSAREAAAYLRTTPSQLAKWRRLGGGPIWVKPLKRKTLYRRADLDAWLASNAVRLSVANSGVVARRVAA